MPLHKLASVFGAVTEKQAEIPGFGIEKRKVIGTFTYAKGREGDPGERSADGVDDPADLGATLDLADQIGDQLREFTRLGGFSPRPGNTPWFGAAIGTRAQAHEAIELAVSLSSRARPQLAARLSAACSELGLPPAASLSYPERTRLTRALALLHQAGQPGRGFRERRALRPEAQAEWATLPPASAGPGAPAEPRLPERDRRTPVGQRGW